MDRKRPKKKSRLGHGPIHGPINLIGRGTRATRICADFCAGQLVKKENWAGCSAHHFLIHGAWNASGVFAEVFLFVHAEVFFPNNYDIIVFVPT